LHKGVDVEADCDCAGDFTCAEHGGKQLDLLPRSPKPLTDLRFCVTIRRVKVPGLTAYHFVTDQDWREVKPRTSIAALCGRKLLQGETWLEVVGQDTRCNACQAEACAKPTWIQNRVTRKKL
jgi:hypothetical protein